MFIRVVGCQKLSLKTKKDLGIDFEGSRRQTVISLPE